MALVLVLYGFGYTTKHGRLVSIKPNESYILVSKTNDHWWHVRKDQNTTPFYVPAQYVREVPSPTQDPDDSANGDSLECLTNTEPVDEANMTKVTAVTPVLIQDGLKETYPFSNFEQTLDNVKTHDPMGDDLLPLATPKTDGLQQVAKPCHVPNLFLHREDQDFPAAPTLPVYYTTPESNISDSDKFSDLSENCTSNTQFMMKQHNLNLAADEMPSSETSPKEQIHGYSEYNNINMVDLYSSVWPSHPATKQGLTLSTTPQVDNESLQSAIYVNVAQLRQSISESPPSAPSSCSPSYFDSEKWEVHVDQESGQEYYYHPTTGQTTWDNPFLDSSTEAEPFPAEEFSSPSPPLSPARRLTTDTATPTWISDWEQLVDETSGQPYFYNPMSGETSWEPPEQLSPYPALMEPMSVHRFHEDLPPPLPEEDYPPEDYPTSDQPELYDELFATGPPTLPREYTLSHVGRTIIPRANLDRSTPPGWNLAVEANGTWVFTNDHSPEQWIKSVDDRGQIYYYVRNGSKSRWNLPELRGHQCMEAPLTPGLSRMENGGEADNVIKNWRHSMGSVPLSSPQDDGRFFPSHRRNTSDYSSDSSSTGNSPETQLNMQNLEKAGILNKTKVSENGKKVRKNWMQTWTVLLGGVLTFHKDPKSAATGSMNKTNHIVPEFAVDLRGATIGWASKEKSSKKNVLELKGKNGVEFLVQYDTESIISDWHKVLTDTIRQLEYQDHHSEEDDRDLYERITHTDPPREDKSGGGVEKRRTSRPSVTHSSNSAADVDQKRVRTKLMKFLMKRPTLQSVKEKGYIRDNVFGCHLAKLCAQERTSCPGFVDKCIKAVEKRGLDIDGLYRVSGNLAVIQKLRFKADHDELDLEDGQWEDVHVITGALKLFFRELPEPLFPFSHFNKFITAIRMPDYNTKLSCFYDLVRSLPPPNHDTMKLLFGHLRRVIQYGEDNRMSVGNVAIVFGPTLLRPEMESSNIAMHMVFQNQIVEFILNEYERIFLSS